MTVVQENGLTQDIILTEVKYVPELWVNLFLIGKALKNGFNIGNEGIKIHLTKGKNKMVFNQIMTTSKCFFVGIKMLPSVKGTLAVVAGKMEDGPRVTSIRQFKE
jgi:hypothetical protein